MIDGMAIAWRCDVEGCAYRKTAEYGPESDGNNNPTIRQLPAGWRYFRKKGEKGKKRWVRCGECHKAAKAKKKARKKARRERRRQKRIDRYYRKLNRKKKAYCREGHTLMPPTDKCGQRWCSACNAHMTPRFPGVDTAW